MKDLVFDFFKEYRFLKLSDLLEIYKITSLESFSAGETIARQGQHYDCIMGIRKGIIRTYILTSDGEERTVRFAKEGDFSSCSKSLLFDEPSHEFLEAVEDVKVIVFNTSKFKKLINENIRLMRLWNKAIMTTLHDAIERIEFFAALKPKERYVQLLEQAPDLVRRVPQKYLASYIGVTTVSLSRIRSRVAPKIK